MQRIEGTLTGLQGNIGRSLYVKIEGVPDNRNPDKTVHEATNFLHRW